MKAILSPLIFLLAMSVAGAKDIQSTWIYVPDESSHEDPWRIVIYDDSSVVSQKLFFGCKREHGTELKMIDGVIEIRTPEREHSVIRKEKDRLVCSRKDRDEVFECVFRENAEWNERFEKAPYPPKNRKEALVVLDQILSEENKKELREMKKEDLILLHHGFGTGLRNGFGLWRPGSQIVKDYGGGHPDGVSNQLIEEYWAILQKRGKPTK